MWVYGRRVRRVALPMIVAAGLLWAPPASAKYLGQFTTQGPGPLAFLKSKVLNEPDSFRFRVRTNLMAPIEAEAIVICEDAGQRRRTRRLFSRANGHLSVRVKPSPIDAQSCFLHVRAGYSDSNLSGAITVRVDGNRRPGT